MKIGEIICQRYGIREEDIRDALKVQQKTGGYLGQILLSQGLITEKQLLEALSLQLNLPLFTVDHLSRFNPERARTLFNEKEYNFLITNNYIPVDFDPSAETITLATNDPLNFNVLSFLYQKFPQIKINLGLVEESFITQFVKSYQSLTKEYKNIDIQEDEVDRLKEIASEAPVIKYLNNLFTKAIEHRATDIHIEPDGKRYRVRFRVDGLLHEIDELDRKLYLALVSRIKLLAGLDIAEKRLPQDGKIAIRVASHFIDLRVSTIPVVNGESVVIRLLYKEKLSFDISTLGLEQDHRELLLSLIRYPYGMILITGPTGSGKTTTLYSLLSILNNTEKKIITVEDPVEYQIDGINQIQVKPEIGYTFAHALRSILRHDPDIIMIGEIRDRETAEIAIHSALTGHLVLSTLHTNDSPSALFRLIEMGIEDYLLNASIIGVVAQRIVRKVCPQCAEDCDPDTFQEKFALNELIERFSTILDGSKIQPKRGRGCDFCLNTGYFGRTAIFEMFLYDDTLKEIFVKTKSLESIRRTLRERYNFRTLREDGFVKALKGITTFEEVLRVA